MVSEQFVIKMTRGSWVVMFRRFKYSSLVKLVYETESIRNKKNLDKVMRVHTHDYIQDSFSYLILKVWEEGSQNYCLSFVFYTFSCHVCAIRVCVRRLWWERNADSRSNLTCLPLQGLSKAIGIIFCFKDMKWWQVVYRWMRKAKFWFMGGEMKLVFSSNTLD